MSYGAFCGNFCNFVEIFLDFDRVAAHKRVHRPKQRQKIGAKTPEV